MNGDKAKALAHVLQQLRARWGWFVGLGGVLLLLGGLAMIYVIAATLASVVFIAMLMIIGGAAQLVHAWGLKPWQAFAWWSVVGVLYVLAGVFALANPVAGAAVLTLLLGGALIAMGALRLWIWYQNRAQQGWRWLALSGVLSLLTGLLIAMGWPENSLVILGVLLAIDLIFQGWGMLALGLALKRSHQSHQP